MRLCLFWIAVQSELVVDVAERLERVVSIAGVGADGGARQHVIRYEFAKDFPRAALTDAQAQPSRIDAAPERLAAFVMRIAAGLAALGFLAWLPLASAGDDCLVI